MTTKGIGNKNRAQRRREAGENQSLSELMMDTSIQEHIVKHKGKEFIFPYKTLDWKTWMKHMGNNWRSDGTFDIGKYYEDMLLDSIQSFPGGAGPTRSVMQSFDPMIMFQLMDIVPKPTLGEDMEESKKELTPSQEEMEAEPEEMESE